MPCHTRKSYLQIPLWQPVHSQLSRPCDIFFFFLFLGSDGRMKGKPRIQTIAEDSVFRALWLTTHSSNSKGSEWLLMNQNELFFLSSLILTITNLSNRVQSSVNSSRSLTRNLVLPINLDTFYLSVALYFNVRYRSPANFLYFPQYW